MTALSRYSLLAAIAAFLLAGCGGGSQSTVPGALPMSDIRQAEAHGHLRMLPGTSSEDLLYVLNFNNGHTYVYSYPGLKLLGQLTGLTESATGLCADKQGDVFVTEEGNGSKDRGSYIVEFAHGQTDPIATLNDSFFPSGCSVDPTTGNLAVTNWVGANVAIYTNAQGSPTYMHTPLELSLTSGSAYDNQGNLFVSGSVGKSEYALAELPSGSSSITLVSLKKSLGLQALQWNDGYLVASSGTFHARMRYLYRIQITGTTGKVVGTTVLDFPHPSSYDSAFGQFLILGNRVLAPGWRCGHLRCEKVNALQRWPYPSGDQTGTMLIGRLAPWGMALSVAPSTK